MPARRLPPGCFGERSGRRLAVYAGGAGCHPGGVALLDGRAVLAEPLGGEVDNLALAHQVGGTGADQAGLLLACRCEGMAQSLEVVGVALELLPGDPGPFTVDHHSC